MSAFSSETVSVGELFAGALVPGLILVGLYMLYILIIAQVKPEWAPPIPQEELDSISTKQLYVRVCKALIPPLALMIAVLGSIFMGITTPTEASGVGALGASLLALLNKRLNWKVIRNASPMAGSAGSSRIGRAPRKRSSCTASTGPLRTLRRPCIMLAGSCSSWVTTRRHEIT